jgi:hypothetical protein
LCGISYFSCNEWSCDCSENAPNNCYMLGWQQ